MEANELKMYQTANGKEPIYDWLLTLKKKDKVTTARVVKAVHKLCVPDGLGNRKPLRGTDGIYELKLDFGPGYRVYYSIVRDKLVLLFCGGNKRTQDRDIEKAKEYLQDYKESVNERTSRKFTFI